MTQIYTILHSSKRELKLETKNQKKKKGIKGNNNLGLKKCTNKPYKIHFSKYQFYS